MSKSDYVYGHRCTFRCGPIVGITRVRTGHVVREMELLCDVEGIDDKEKFFAEFAKKARPLEIAKFVEAQLVISQNNPYIPTWINLSPLYLSRKAVRSELHSLLQYKSNGKRVFHNVGFEIQEMAHVSPYAQGFLNGVRGAGYEFALDDVGSGKLANRAYVAELLRDIKPRKIKLDMSLFDFKDPDQVISIISSWKKWLDSCDTKSDTHITVEGMPVNPTAWILAERSSQTLRDDMFELLAADPELSKVWYNALMESIADIGPVLFQLRPTAI